MSFCGFRSLNHTVLKLLVWNVNVTPPCPCISLSFVICLISFDVLRLVALHNCWLSQCDKVRRHAQLCFNVIVTLTLYTTTTTLLALYKTLFSHIFTGIKSVSLLRGAICVFRLSLKSHERSLVISFQVLEFELFFLPLNLAKHSVLGHYLCQLVDWRG